MRELIKQFLIKGKLMKKLFMLAIIFMECGSCKGGEKHYGTLVSADDKDRSRLISELVSMSVREFPVTLGNKKFKLEEIEKLSPEQRKILIKNSNPSCCSIICGKSSVTLWPQDIEEFEETMPASFKKDLVVTKSTVRRPCSDVCIDCGSTIVGVPPLIAAIFTGVFSIAVNPCICVPALAYASLGLVSCSCCSMLSIQSIRCLCREQESYTFKTEGSVEK